MGSRGQNRRYDSAVDLCSLVQLVSDIDLVYLVRLKKSALNNVGCTTSPRRLHLNILLDSF